MLTDAPPRKRNQAEFLKSDRTKDLDLSQNTFLPDIAKHLESAMKAGTVAEVRKACAEFLAIASDFYKVPPCGVRVLAARPLRVRERWSTELFGDYHPETVLIRVWMRTAVRKDVTSFGTFLSTLRHEFCHHLDFHFPVSLTHGTLAASTSEPLRFTTMREEHPRNVCSGCPCRVGAGGLTGRRRIGMLKTETPQTRQ